MTVIVDRVESYEKVWGFVERVFANLDLFENLKRRFSKNLLEIDDLPRKVIVKPNFLKWIDLDSGCVTHPELIKAVASFLAGSNQEIFILEGGFTKNAADRYFNEFGLYRYGNCINLNTGRFIEVQVDGEKLRSVKASEIAVKLLKESFFISLPKLKVHHLTKVTISIKNNMGFLKKPAVSMHLSINPKLVDLLNVFNPHLIIVDGVVGGENSESNTRPVRHGVMLAGDNAVEVDAVGAYLMGFEPEDIGFLKIACERGLGEIRIDKIDVVGDLEGLRKRYGISSLRRFLGRLSI
ncbi:MAG: DUF362 domain-containing protein [Archaeoglobus sp.]|nr:DUF362 domain-containing protein [Archaeoglobus sp.]